MFTNRMSASVRPTGSSRRQRWSMNALRAMTLCVAVFGATPAPAADQLGADDRRAIEKTVRGQLDAFGRDDANGAFGFATPDIQRLFGSPERFMRMVRESYEPVYRASRVRFVRVDAVDGQWVQTVELIDAESRVWRGLFTMKRQANRSWKVGGCELQQTRAIAT